MRKTAAKQSPTTDAEATKQTVTQVLHVDDDDDFLVISKRLLERQGSFHVECALSVEHALQKIGQKSYAAIVSDYRMFGRSGLEFLKELRTKGDTVPFFLVTGERGEEIAIQALGLGADRYFSKNASFDELFVELASAINEAVKAKRTTKTPRSREG